MRYLGIILRLKLDGKEFLSIIELSNIVQYLIITEQPLLIHVIKFILFSRYLYNNSNLIAKYIKKFDILWNS